MLEVIKTLVEAPAGGFPSLREMRRDKQRRQLGAVLFTLYAELNQITVTAEQIVAELEGYIADIDNGGQSTPYRIHKLRTLVRRQGKSLRFVFDRFEIDRIVLQVIESDAYNRLCPLISLKEGALVTLWSSIQRDRLPAGPTQAEVDRWAALMATRPQPHDRTLHDMYANRLVEESERHWFNLSLRDDSWGPEFYAPITEYLEVRQPRQQLVEIRSALTVLRAALSEHFAISDVLLEIKQKRPEG